MKKEKQSSNRSGKHKGREFMLVELLVVVAIIAILAAMLLSALNKARAAGQAAVCRSNLKQQGLAFAGYEADFDSYIPPSKGAVDVGGGNYEFLDWQWALTAYIGLNPDLCRDKYSQGKAWRESTVFWCKAPIATIPSGTTLNPKNTGNDTYRYAINSNFISKKRKTGKSISQTCLVMECFYSNPNMQSWMYHDASSPANIPHENGTNLLYLDYHVGYAKFTVIPRFSGNIFWTNEN